MSSQPLAQPPAPSLLPGRLIRRYKRFLADVDLDDGERVTAHCANPGSMTTCMVEGGRVWLSRSPNPRRKLPYTWELAEVGEQLVCVNTGQANEMVARALAAGGIAELGGYGEVTREVRYGEGSRIDFLLAGRERRCFVEVKSATLASGPRGVAFPDSVTARGSKHLRELTAVVTAGDRAVLLFVCNRTGVDELRPADEIDPVYGYYLRQARTAGVEVLAYGCELDVTRPEMFATLAGPVTVRLPAFEYQPKLPATGRARVKRGVKKQVRLRPA